MIARVFATSLLAGFLAGLVVAMIQHFTTTPLIVAAEAYESHASSDRLRDERSAEMQGARLVLVHTGHDAASGAGAETEWAPGDGLERTFYTSTVTVATAVGFALLLLAGMLAAGDSINWQRGLSWATAGFIVTGLAPALGLPPELPGMLAADLVDRQIWWIGTAVATAGALWLFLRGPGLVWQALSIVLLVLPHVLGAPHPGEAEASRVPAELAARFASASLVVHAVLWALTGFLAGWFWERNKSSGPA